MNRKKSLDSPKPKYPLPSHLKPLFCFVNKGKAKIIREQKKRAIYSSRYAIEFPNKNGQAEKVYKKGKERLIPLGNLQFSRTPELRNSHLSQEDVFKFYIWCGIGEPSQKEVLKYADLLPSIQTLKEPTIIKIKPDTDKDMYVIDPSLKIVKRAVERTHIQNYQKGEFDTPVVIIGRPLSWEEVSVPHYSLIL